MSAWNDSIKETQPRSSTRGRNSYILTIIRGRRPLRRRVELAVGSTFTGGSSSCPN